VGTSFRKQRRQARLLWTLWQGLLSTSYTVLSPLHAKTFPVFGKNWKFDTSPLKILVRSENCPTNLFF
jgi:hypothetical protein